MIVNFAADLLSHRNLCTVVILLYSEQNAATPLKFTYTPMHGVGYPFFAEAMKVFGFAPCITVEEQVVFTLSAVVACNLTTSMLL